MLRARQWMALGAVITALGLIPASRAQPIINGGQVNISGATLFRDFFTAGASTLDFNDVDGDGCSWQGPPAGCLDQLANPVWPGPTWWAVSYRGVGSVNGVTEFVEFQCNGTIPTSVPPEGGYYNTNPFQFPNPNGCWPVGGAPCCASGTPLCPDSIDIAVTDVPTRWTVRTGRPQQAHPDRKPGEPGYGFNPQLSHAGHSNTLTSLQCLNTNTTSPNASTVFDTEIAWVPIAYIANRGTGLENVDITDLKFLFITGRWPNGENFVAITRDSGSGTRNGAMNSICLDPSFGVGDNSNLKTDDSRLTILGPSHSWTNMGGSSRLEEATQNRRLAVSYTGLAGPSRAAADAAEGRYELLNIRFDDRGGVEYVRPTLAKVIYNAQSNPGTPNTGEGFQIGGPETFATRGNPQGGAFPMANQHAADYINNITDSIDAFVAFLGTPITPGEFLASTFFLSCATTVRPEATDPCNFIPNPCLNTELQEWTFNNSVLLEPAYGITPANRVPTRTNSPQWSQFTLNTCDCDYPADGVYSDGSSAAYINRHTGGTIPAGNLNARNALAGDFNGDGVRDIFDIPAMMEALHDPTAYVLANSTSGDPVVPEIIGDFNGDGNFDCRDVRYFADGLAINPFTGNLDRKMGFVLVDVEWFRLTGDSNFFNTSFGSGFRGTYTPGDARFDVAGNTPNAGGPPVGYDCVIDREDARYIVQNISQTYPDLSADVTGDLVVDALDAEEVSAGCLIGDINGDGLIDNEDIDPFVNLLINP